MEIALFHINMSIDMSNVLVLLIQPFLKDGFIADSVCLFVSYLSTSSSPTFHKCTSCYVDVYTEVGLPTIC